MCCAAIRAARLPATWTMGCESYFKIEMLLTITAMATNAVAITVIVSIINPFCNLFTKCALAFDVHLWYERQT